MQDLENVRLNEDYGKPMQGHVFNNFVSNRWVAEIMGGAKGPH